MEKIFLSTKITGQILAPIRSFIHGPLQKRKKSLEVSDIFQKNSWNVKGLYVSFSPEIQRINFLTLSSQTEIIGYVFLEI